MDKTLDEVGVLFFTNATVRLLTAWYLQIIATRPKGIRRATSRRGSAKQQVLGNGPVASRTRAATGTANGTKAPAATTATSQQPADKIIVSNLPPDVNELQIKELFHTTVGPLKDVTLHYDSQGRSKGVAAVHFQRRGDGTKAFQQYNNRLIDGS
ncbi:uncharacterized protein LAESUDRAFT_652224 [Laetiporus sulphureus 93-53]|uniref:RRM domain-containing protein n=1 Tax=Laetiporus sulphureus 93-53 TaxID=1314785 RepID=A0A165EI18_9APHY|nr:uncharacterized protein LAESUDRAFT_652224 [Laetiporus sulphureus 93-53]KZT07092.1 hypothetical protein LAESUDRAFT_652224 [Laetiporus sulphureus 93-53]